MIDRAIFGNQRSGLNLEFRTRVTRRVERGRGAKDEVGERHDTTSDRVRKDVGVGLVRFSRTLCRN
jgi:hypothetical protein